MSGSIEWTQADLAQLAARGIDAAEAARQLALLADPPAAARLARPCTPGDGLQVLEEAQLEALEAVHAQAARAGRVQAFVPASGAATRMFKDLLAAMAAQGDWRPAETLAAAAAGSAGARALQAFLEGLDRFAFRDELAAAIAPCGTLLEELAAHGPWRVIAETLLFEPGLGYANSPKGLLSFHRDGAGARTAFEEHLVEAATLARDAKGVCRLHFTVSPEHRERFEALLARSAPRFGARLGVTYDVSFSEQHPATDTIAAHPNRGPFRDPDGALLFRPAGHGALLHNLADLAEHGGDLVFLKNIDNVTVDRLREPTTRWSAVVVGLAAQLSAQAHAWCARLGREGDAAVEPARAFASQALGVSEPPADAASLIALLDRPLRVCGMVRNTGEPGGGPFWVHAREGGITRQIVESAEVDVADAGQMAILRSATHFNPVFLACALRDRDGRAHDLSRYLDPHAVIITRKSSGGQELLALERPGLWNGAMAHWNTVFVEVPLTVFQPVKTLLDLLRPEHQA
jgi:hypothetical protein